MYTFGVLVDLNWVRSFLLFVAEKKICAHINKITIENNTKSDFTNNILLSCINIIDNIANPANTVPTAYELP